MKALTKFTFLIIMVLSFARKSQMTGGWSDVEDLNSPHILKFAKLATQKIVADINSPYHLKLMHITHAQKQVVSGMNYKIHFAIASSECLKSGNYTDEQVEACPLQSCEHPLMCSAKVWDQPWMRENRTKVTEHQCDPGDGFC